MNHPRGIWVLFATEMWERFSYYGMRALLVLYLISATGGLDAPVANPGFGWTQADAYRLYGLYTWAVYLTPIFGGMLADRFLGTHRSLLLGGSIIAAGHLTLAATELFAIAPGEVVGLDTSPGALLCFVSGLLLIIVGTGFFKPCVAVMVGELYEADDPRREGGFTIFYMGINVGSLLAPLVAGTLGETLGWHWGFGAAAVGMILGLATYALLRPRYLAGIGQPPRHGQAGMPTRPMLPLDATEWHRVIVILVLAFFGNVAFWAGFEQAGSSLNVFAAQSTDRTLWGLLDEPFPATWFQSVNPAAVVLFAPLFAWLWVFLARRDLDPSTPVKFCIGLWLLGLAFLAMVFGALEARTGALAGPQWLLVTYVVVTWGELCLSPVGLAMVTRLAPLHLQSLLMGVWYFTFSLANLVAGELARFSTRLASGEVRFVLDGLPGFFLMLVLGPIAVGVFMLALVPWLKRWMHGLR
ncbi:MAG: peptide MFS transporter [Pseudomonadales bacterium]|jgi:POT family proton-dependent oligopeptide transporter|nr:peptide MFS transporter [Pseudomonadales bacterium]